MRVGVISSFDEPGSARTVPALVDGLAGLGHQVCVLGDTGTGAATGIGELVDAIDHRLGDLDVLHAHGWQAGLATELAVRNDRQLGRRRPATVHTVSRPLPEGRTHAERAVVRRADRVITTHEPLNDGLVAAGVSRRRITVVPPGVDTAAGPVSETCAVRTGPSYRLLVVGGPGPRGVDLLDLACALHRPPGVEVLVCGTPEDPLDPRAESIAREGGFRLRDLTGDAGSRNELFGSVDLVLSGERHGFTHLEAMCAGVPLVAVSPLAAQAVVDRITGVHAVGLVPGRLPRLVRGLLDNATARHRMAVAGRDRAVTRYPWSRIVAETARVYEQAVPASRVCGRPEERR